MNKLFNFGCECLFHNGLNSCSQYTHRSLTIVDERNSLRTAIAEMWITVKNAIAGLCVYNPFAYHPEGRKSNAIIFIFVFFCIVIIFRLMHINRVFWCFYTSILLKNVQRAVDTISTESIFLSLSIFDWCLRVLNAPCKRLQLSVEFIFKFNFHFLSYFLLFNSSFFLKFYHCFFSFLFNMKHRCQ